MALYVIFQSFSNSTYGIVDVPFRKNNTSGGITGYYRNTFYTELLQLVVKAGGFLTKIAFVCHLSQIFGSGLD